jgi:hypothetical protein
MLTCLLACILHHYIIINSTSHYIWDVMLVVNPGNGLAMGAGLGGV